MSLEQLSRQVVVTTDASRTGWGAVCNGHTALGSWMGPRLQWRINCLELHSLAPMSRSVEPACLASGRDVANLSGPSQTLRPRAPSTRQSYALKWYLFIDWCSSCQEDPQRCPVSIVLSFQQEKLKHKLFPSPLKVYVSAIAVHHSAVDGRSLGKHDLTARFLRGTRRFKSSQITPCSLLGSLCDTSGFYGSYSMM